MLKLPGTWIDSPDRNRAHQIGGQFMAIREALEEAAIALELFTATRAAGASKASSGSYEWQREGRLLRIYARSFLFTADRVLAIACAIGKHPHAAENQKKAIIDIEAAVPGVHEVRNSSAHVEDRMMFKGRRGTTIEPGPLVNDAIHAPSGGVMMIENIVNTRFGGTLADGSHGEIDVVPATLERLVSAVNSLAMTFAWTGPPS